MTLILLALMAAVLNENGWADDKHYVNVLIGNRAAALGGAYTALADDPSGCYYNPAGIALAPYQSFSASMNVFQRSVKTYQNALADTGGNLHDWQQESSALLPNFFGVIKNFGKGVVGLSYAVPDAINRRQRQSFHNIQSNLAGNPVQDFTIDINDNDHTFLFGPSYAVRLKDNFSLGCTLYVYYRDREVVRNQLLQFEQGQHYWINYYETRQDWGLRPMLGLIWEPAEKWALGLTAAKTFVTSGKLKQQTTFRDSSATSPYIIDGISYDFSDADTVYFNSTTTHPSEDQPLRLALGATYFASPRFLISADLSFHQDDDAKEATWNLAAGAEYYLTDAVALRCGLYSDRANTPALNSNAVNQPEHIDIYGASLGVAVFAEQASLSLGIGYGRGDGQAQIVADSTTIQDVTIENLTIFVAAGYSF